MNIDRLRLLEYVGETLQSEVIAGDGRRPAGVACRQTVAQVDPGAEGAIDAIAGDIRSEAWDMSDLVDIVEFAEAPPAKVRGPYKKREA